MSSLKDVLFMKLMKECVSGISSDTNNSNQINYNNLEKEFREGHIMRLNEGICTGAEGSIFLDMLSNMERVGDHAVNIAEYVLGEMGTLERQKVKVASKMIANE